MTDSRFPMYYGGGAVSPPVGSAVSLVEQLKDRITTLEAALGDAVSLVGQREAVDQGGGYMAHTATVGASRLAHWRAALG